MEINKQNYRDVIQNSTDEAIVGTFKEALDKRLMEEYGKDYGCNMDLVFECQEIESACIKELISRGWKNRNGKLISPRHNN